MVDSPLVASVAAHLRWCRARVRRQEEQLKAVGDQEKGYVRLMTLHDHVHSLRAQIDAAKIRNLEKTIERLQANIDRIARGDGGFEPISAANLFKASAALPIWHAAEAQTQTEASPLVDDAAAAKEES